MDMLNVARGGRRESDANEVAVNPVGSPEGFRSVTIENSRAVAPKNF
jgi:hypothetical protein